MKNIVFIGLPGSGKSVLGKMTASALKMEFIDMDSLIEKKAGMTISAVFENFGEKYFRDIESGVASDLSLSFGKVIASGGGTLLREENVKALKKNGILVFLDRNPNVIAANIKHMKRPLLSNDPAKIFALSQSRRNLYLDSADLVFPNNGPLKEDFGKLIKKISKIAESRSFSVIGDPISHSLSPLIHNTVFGVLNIFANYRLCHVLSKNLKTFTQSAAYSLKGFNVTIPHKRDILPLLDVVDEKAVLCGAVNTVVIKKSKLFGYNTDILGLVNSLKNCEGAAQKNVIIFGTGGAAIGAAFATAMEKAGKITILGRNIKSADEIKTKIQSVYDAPVFAKDMQFLSEAAHEADIFINATPLGMAGFADDFTSFDFLKNLPKRALVYDLVYNPAQTSLLKEASALGLNVKNGLDMLVYQALAADELFLETELDIHFLYKVVKETLSKNQNA